jgi:hypothetical protein
MNGVAMILRQNPSSDKSVRGEYRRGGFVRQSAALSLIQAVNRQRESETVCWRLWHCNVSDRERRSTRTFERSPSKLRDYPAVWC